jgi:CMP-N,N'-diacetyllegionaminic acid synthase
MKNFITILIARGGSKRLPGKNIKPFCDRPLLAWSIIQSRSAKLVEDTWLSTDDKDIAAVGREYGARIIMRDNPVDSLDHIDGGIPTASAIRKIRREYYDFKNVVVIIPTHTLKRENDIDDMIRLYNEIGCRKIIAAVCQHETSVFLCTREHVLSPMFWNTTGAIYSGRMGWGIVDVNLYLQIQDMYTDGFPMQPTSCYFYEAEEWQNNDIDTLEEFIICEALFRERLLDIWEKKWKELNDSRHNNS